MKIITKDAKTNKKVVYDIQELKNYPSHRNTRDDKDDEKENDKKDDRIEELEKRVEALEKEVDTLTKGGDKEEEEEVEEDIDEDEEEPEDETEEEEVVEDLSEDSDDAKMCDSRSTLSSVGRLLKKPTSDSVDSDTQEADIWKKRLNGGK